ncbi:hypothetical protein M501DRAFT_829817 [Patellaria atrata CBS 101060]|uniref:Uncharacterized protein n=1 Tax=Patellaria atrata CBS 101060 TaxID=1346257 RepID=A0A9P4VRD9_9PEZI|nr:hypothetical protein M501DRAFT_829817 [Patellaria atrata CBS 101060]
MRELLNFIYDNEEAFRSKYRLDSLYSDFSVYRTTNPDGYQANISAWKRAITKASSAGLIPSKGGVMNDLFVIGTGEELARALETTNLGRPLALGAVIQDAVAKKEMIPLNDFLSTKTSIYHDGWSISPFSVIVWSLRQLGVLGDASNTNNKLAAGTLVVVANLEEVTREIITTVFAKTSYPDLLFTPRTFASEFSHIFAHPLSQTDLSILLTYLSRDRHLVSHNKHTIKFASPHSDDPPTPITESDTSIANLRALIQDLSAQIPRLISTVEKHDRTAREAVVRRDTTTARAALRSKKLVDATLSQRIATLHQLEEVFARIEAAASNVLAELNRKVGGVEGAEDVAEKLREQMETGGEERESGERKEGEARSGEDEGKVGGVGEEGAGGQRGRGEGEIASRVEGEDEREGGACY